MNKEEVEILIYDKYPFDPNLYESPLGEYESPLGEKEYPPTKYKVPIPNFGPGSPFEWYWTYYRSFVTVFFITKAMKILETTGNLDEMKHRKYNMFGLLIEAPIEGRGGWYEEELSYDFTAEAKWLIKKHNEKHENQKTKE